MPLVVLGMGCLQDLSWMMPVRDDDLAGLLLRLPDLSFMETDGGMNLGMLLLAFFIAFLVPTVLLFVKKPIFFKILAYFFKLAPLIYPLLLARISLIIGSTTLPLIYTIFAVASYVFLVVSWGLATCTVKQPYNRVSAVSQVWIGLLRVARLGGSSIIIALCHNKLTQSTISGIYYGTNFLITLVEAFWVIYSFEYLRPQLEYYNLAIKITNFTFAGLMLWQQLFKISLTSLNSILFLLVIMIALERIGIINRLFESRYEQLFRKSTDLSNPIEIMALIQSVESPDLTSSYIGIGIFKRLKSGFLAQLMLNRLTVTQNMSSSVKGKKRYSTPKIDISSSQKAEDLEPTLIRHYLEDKFSTKGVNQLNVYFIYWALRHNLFMDAFKNSILRTREVPWWYPHTRELIRMDLEDFIDKIRRQGFHEQHWRGTGMCRARKRVQILTRETIEDSEYVKQISVDCRNLLQIEEKLVVMWAHKKVIVQQEVCELIEQQDELKRRIMAKIEHGQAHLYTNPELLMHYLVFLTAGCEQNFNAFRLVEKYLLKYNICKEQMLSSKGRPIAFTVSGESKNVGMILNCTQLFHKEFGFDSDKIGQISINQILPQMIAKHHNEYMIRFLETGVARFMGQNQYLYVCAKGKLRKVLVHIKIVPDLFGIRYACIMTFDNSPSRYFLYDDKGKIGNQWSSNPEMITDQIDVPEKEKKTFDILKTKTYFYASRYIPSKIELSRLIGSEMFIGVCQIKENIKAMHVFQVTTELILQHSSHKLDMQQQQDRPIRTQREAAKEQYKKAKSTENSNMNTHRKEIENYIATETDVWDVGLYDKKTSQLLFWLFLLLVLVLIGVIMVYTESQSSMVSIFAMIKYQILVGTGFRARVVDMTTAMMLIDSINKGGFNDSAGFSAFGFTSFRNFIVNNSQNRYLAGFKLSEYSFSLSATTVPAIFVEKVAGPHLHTFPSISPGSVESISFFQANSLIKSMLSEVMAKDLMLDSPTYSYLKSFMKQLCNGYMNELNKTVYDTIVSLNILDADARISKLIWMNAVIVLVTFLALSCVFYTLKSYSSRYQNLYKMLLSVHPIHFIKKSKKLAEARKWLEVVNDKIIEQVKITPQKSAIDCYIKGERKRRFQSLELQKTFEELEEPSQLVESSRSDPSLIAQTGNRRIFQHTKLFYSEWSFILIIIILLVPINYFFLMNTTMGIKNRVNVVNFYDSANTLLYMRLSNCYLMSALVSKYTGADSWWDTQMELNTVDYLKSASDFILHRTFENGLVKQLEWNFVKNLLYSPFCNQTDARCKKVLNGAFNQSFTSAVVQFLDEIIWQYNSIDKISNNITRKQEMQAKITQLYIAYQFYMRTMMPAVQSVVTGTIDSIFSNNAAQLRLFLFGVLVPTFIVYLVWSVWSVFSKARRLKLAKKQLLGILPIHIIVEQIPCYLELSQLSQYR